MIGLNERRPSLPDEGYDPPLLPLAPINLVGIQTESGIRLNWDIDNLRPGLSIPVGYKVYRKSSTDESFLLVKTVIGGYNRSYDDNTVEPLRLYSYFVTSYIDGNTSTTSNYISILAPTYPKPVLSFDAIQRTRSQIELRWENDHSQYILETKLSKYIVGISNDYETIGTFSPNEQDYFDNSAMQTLGRKVIYKINHVTSLGESNAKYDLVHIPFRDISQPSPVYIKKIKFSDWSIERWPAGKPEFYITVMNMAQGSTPRLVQNQINCKFSYRSSTSQTFRGKKVLDWEPGYWYDKLSFYVIEYDRSWGKLTVNASVKYNKKNTDKTGLDASAGADYSITFSDKGEECGNAYLDYFGYRQQWLEFPNYGVQVLVAESDW